MMQHSIESNRLKTKGQFSSINKGFFILEISTALLVSLVLLHALFCYLASIQSWIHYIKTYQQVHHAMQSCTIKLNTANDCIIYSWGTLHWHISPCIHEARLSIIRMTGSWSDVYGTLHTLTTTYAL